MVSLLPQHWTTLWMTETNSQLSALSSQHKRGSGTCKFHSPVLTGQVRPLVLVIDTTYRSLHQEMEVKTGSFDIFI